MQHLTKQWALTGPDRPRPGASFGLGACSEPITSSESGSSELVVCSSCRAQTENLHLVLKKIHGAVLTPRLLHLQEVLLDVFADARPELRLAEAVSVWGKQGLRKKGVRVGPLAMAEALEGLGQDQHLPKSGGFGAQGSLPTLHIAF